MDRVTSIDSFEKTREAPASGSFSVFRRSVTAPRPPLASESTLFAVLAAGVSILLGAREGITSVKNDNLSFLRVCLSQIV